MSFATPLGLLALLALPAVLALHLFRRRRAPRRVAGLFLFAPDAQAAAAGRRRDRLQRTASLWLELAAALALALWLGGLTIGSAAQPVHCVVVLDDSASMAAEAGGASWAERARAAVREAVAEQPAGARVTLIRTGPRPAVGLGPRAPLAQLDSALERYDPRQPGHDPGPALDLGRQLAEGGPLVFVTDHAPRSVPVRGYEVVAVGVPATNAAIVGARRTALADDPERERLYVDLRAFGGAAAAVALRVVASAGRDAPEVELVHQTVELAADKTTRLSLSVPRQSGPVEVVLGADPLAIDNRALLLPELRRTVALANLLSDEASAALRLERGLLALRDVRAVADPQHAHLVLSSSPSVLRDWHTELVIAAAEGERDAWIGPFLIERRHRVLQGITLDGVVWSAGQGAVEGTPLISADAQPLFTEVARDDALRLWLNLDPLQTNLPASPDWPILLANVVDATRARLPGVVAANVRVGELLQFRHAGTPDEARQLRLIDPRGRPRPARGRRVLEWEASVPGLHVLEREGEQVARFAVHFVDAAESDLSAAASLRTQPDASVQRALGADDDAGRQRSPWAARILALLLLAVAALDWLVLGRPL